jgi:uncharacterized protein
MNILIAGATGFIGQALTTKLLEENTITIITRSPSKAKKIFPSSPITILSWEELNKTALNIFPSLDTCINLCGANVGAKRWSRKQKEILLNSRLKPTKTLLELCKKTQTKPTLINANGIGIYGPSKPNHTTPFTENSPLPSPPEDFLADLAVQWEQAVYSNAASSQRVMTLRLAPVCHANGGIIKKLTIPFKFGLGGPIANGKQAFPWVSLRDVVTAIEFLIQQKALYGPINLISPDSITQKEFAQQLGHHLRRPAIFPMPKFIVKILFGEMGQTLLLQGTRALPKKITEAGFTFNDTELSTALMD